MSGDRLALAPAPARASGARGDADVRPAVSIVIPAFAAEAFIADTLAGAAEQTFRNYEVIVVDDASTDATAEVVAKAAEGDRRVRLVRLAENGGPGAARNRALDLARGDWICLLDADDSMDPARIERLLALAEAKGADMVSDNLLLVPQDGSPPRPMIPPEAFGPCRRMELAEFVDGNIFYAGKPARVSLGFMQPLISRAFLERHAIRYPQGVRSGEDFVFYLRCLEKGASWWITPEPGYRYALRAGSMTERQNQGDLHAIVACEARMISQARSNGDAELVRRLRRHKRDLDKAYLYRRFTDLAKAKRWTDARACLFSEPYAPRFIIGQALRQAPIVFAKAIRGGYRRRSGGSAAARGESGRMHDDD